MDNQNQQVPPVNNTEQNQAPQVTPGNQVPPKDFMETLEYYFVTKAPFQLPAGLKEAIVRFGPWISLIFLLTFIPLIFAVIGLNATLSFYAPLYYAHFVWSIYTIIPLITFVLGIMALPGLFRRKMSGWNLVFYEMLVSFVGSVISGNIVGAIVSVIIGLYIWFQVRSYYK